MAHMRTLSQIRDHSKDTEDHTRISFTNSFLRSSRSAIRFPTPFRRQTSPALAFWRTNPH